MARITLEFDMPEDDFRAAIERTDARAMGITVESIAAYALLKHAPEDGYIRWHITQ